MRPFKIIKNHQYFESQEKDESVILITRKHWLALTWPFIASVLSGLLLIVFFRITLNNGQLFAPLDVSGQASFELIIILYSVLVAFGSWLMRYLNVLILTNKHLVDISQKAFFSRSVSALALENIEDVSIDKHGLLATVLDFGTIKIQTAGELPNFELKSISDPETVQKTIMQAKQSY